MTSLSPINHGEAICSSITAIDRYAVWTNCSGNYMENSYMQNAKVLNQKEVKAIIAKHFDVPETKVVASRYSYMVLTDDEESSDDKKEKEGE